MPKFKTHTDVSSKRTGPGYFNAVVEAETSEKAKEAVRKALQDEGYRTGQTIIHDDPTKPNRLPWF